MAEVLHLADSPKWRQNPTIEHEELAPVVELRRRGVPTQPGDEPEEDSTPPDLAWTEYGLVARRALLHTVEPPISVEGAVTKAVGTMVVLLYNHAEQLRRDISCLGPDESAIIDGDIDYIMKTIQHIEQLALGLAEQGDGEYSGNSPDYIKQAVEIYLYNNHPNLYDIACPPKRNSAQ